MAIETIKVQLKPKDNQGVSKSKLVKNISSQIDS